MSEISMYSGASGMENQQTNLDIIANNLANLNTTSFKSSRASFADLMYQKLKAAGADVGNGESAPTGVEIGNGSQLVSTTKVFTQGRIQNTGQDTDISIEGDGFLEVLRPDGTLAYTRAGDLRINSQGIPTTSTGYQVQSGFQAIPTGGKMAIAPNGQVTIQDSNNNVLSSFRIQLARFPNPGGLQSIGGNLYLPSESSGAAELGNPDENGFGRIHQGALEKSNVSAVQSMVDMIIAQRCYEANSKSIQTSSDVMATVNQLKRG